MRVCVCVRVWPVYVVECVCGGMSECVGGWDMYVWCVCVCRGEQVEAPSLVLLGCQAYDHIFSFST